MSKRHTIPQLQLPTVQALAATLLSECPTPRPVKVRVQDDRSVTTALCLDFRPLIPEIFVIG